MKSGSFFATLASAPAGAANTEFAVLHGLGGPENPTTPRGFLVIRRNQAATLYESSTAWTTTTAYFKSDTATARFTVMFFA